MKELELYDIYGTWHVPFWQTRIFLFSVLGLVAALLLFGIYLFYKKYKKNKSIPLAQQLLSRLQSLSTSLITNKEDAQKAYGVITDALKAYFEHYYAKPFKTYTDMQMQQVLDSDFPDEFKEALKKLLEDGMQVKFAREQALQAQVNAHVQLTINIINHLEKVQKSS